MQVKGDVAINLRGVKIVVYLLQTFDVNAFHASALFWREFRIAVNLLTLEFAHCIALLLWY